MKVCTTYGSEIPLRKESKMHEIRLDVFTSIPKINNDSIIALCGNGIRNVPKEFNGMIDIGSKDVNTEKRTIRSVHDFNRTPSSDEIVSLLKGGNHISKGAFMVSSFTDLWNIFNASKRIKTRHVLVGMGITGQITRVRSSLLGNEFTYGYHGTPTAPGQMTAEELESINDECQIVGIIGKSLSHSMSPVMQDAAMKSAGINGRYLTFESPDLHHFKDVMNDYNIRGVNVTIPYKEEIIKHLDSVSKTAKEVGAVNTIINDEGQLMGKNTDVAGIKSVVSPVIDDCEKVLIIGSGGVARATAYTFNEFSREIAVVGRNRDTVSKLSRDFGAENFSGKLKDYDIIVNCTPIGLVDGRYPIDIDSITSEQVVFDMVYGRRTKLIDVAERKGCDIIRGEDMLVEQGAASFRSWFNVEPDKTVMKEALR